MARLVKDFDEDCKRGNYIVRAVVGDALPTVIVYDNRTGSESEYYSIYRKPIQRIRQDKDLYVLYI